MDAVNLLDLDAQGLDSLVESLGERTFRARQLKRWIHRQGASDFDSMTDLARSLRQKLRGRAVVAAPAVLSHSTAADATQKWLLGVGARMRSRRSTSRKPIARPCAFRPRPGVQ